MVAAGDIVYASDVQTVKDYTTGRPLVRLIQQVAQSVTSQVTPATAVTFGASSESIDTHGFHDTVTNNTRITPNIAGYYRATGIVWLAGATTTQVMYAAIM